jgi:hypothetical protein
MSNIRQNIKRILSEIEDTALRCGRNPSDIKLMAVTKTVDDVRIRAALDSGITILGENYVQEAKEKIARIGRQGIEWHMIGYLQSNKAKYAVQLFDMVHSVSKMSLVSELDRRSGALGRIMNIMLEVNVSGEPTKSGLEPSAVIPFIQKIAEFPNISIQGLMTMPPWVDDPEDARQYFRRLRQLRDEINEGIEGVTIKELSMGMTQDYQVAIEEGSTIIRIGRGIFGERL